MSPASDSLQELAAGYVLGNLSSAEAEQFATLLAANPELAAEVAALQEALALMPYGLEPAAAKPELRSQILTAAALALPAMPKRHGRQPGARSGKRRWLAIAAGLIAAAALGQLGRLYVSPIPQLSGTAALNLEQAWVGLDQLLADHRRSLANPAGPADFTVRQPAELVARVEGFETTLTALPLLPDSTGQLVGGSNCRFGKTRGLRLTYRIGDQDISAYQLTTAAMPTAQPAARLTLEQPDGTTLVVWREENYLYALVAALPAPRLRAIAVAMGAT